MNHYHVLSLFRNSGVHRGRNTVLAAIFLFVINSSNVLGQTQAFLDNFNRSSLTTSAPTTYVITVTAGDGGAAITAGAFLELTNDATTGANGDGIVYVSGLTQDFQGTYNQVLHSNACPIEWTFNFRYNRTANPSGMFASNYGTAIILANTNDVFSGTGAGNGYAIVFGSSGTPDPIRLVKYAGGLTGTVTTVISSGNNDINAVNDYVSVRVKYEPTNDSWSLFIRDDGTTSWSDPSAGVTIQKGSTTSDNTYTSIPLTHFGFYWAYATAVAQTSQFDNFAVKLIPSTTPIITVSTIALPSFGTVLVGNYSNSQSFTISGTNLVDNIIITPPTGFEMRTGLNSFSSDPITLPQMSGAVGATVIDVRFYPQSAMSYSGNIVCSSSGAITRTVVVGGLGAAPGLELFFTDDPSHTDAGHATVFPHSGMGIGTLYGADDWTYQSPSITFYIVPSGTQSIGAAEFDINWDPAKANLTVLNGTMFDFFATQNISAGKIRINTGASSSMNVLPSPGKYLARVEVSIAQPGFHEFTVTGTDFRSFVGDEQQNLLVTSHSGTIKFYLGDFTSQDNLTTTGDGKINFDDLALFASAYFSESDGDPAGYKTKFDIGPTNSTGNYFLLPNPDGRIQFEDLAIFSLGYGKSAASQLPKQNSKPVLMSVLPPSSKRDGTVVLPVSISGNDLNVRALSITLSYPHSLEYAGFEKSGETNNTFCFMAAKAQNNFITLDAAVIGTEHNGITKNGIIAYVLFKTHSVSKNNEIKILSAIVRDDRNKNIEVCLQSDALQESNIPTTFKLNQNYPNPFNLSTEICYELPMTSSVTLTVFDLLGCEIATLIHTQQDAGVYQLRWNGRNALQQDVSSGVYVYRFTARDPSTAAGYSFISTKKMVLVK